MNILSKTRFIQRWHAFPSAVKMADNSTPPPPPPPPSPFGRTVKSMSTTTEFGTGTDFMILLPIRMSGTI